MQAANPLASSIKINFGERQNANTPVNFSLILDLFSAEQEKIRAEFSQTFNTEIPKTSLAIQFTVESGSASAVAQSLTKTEHFQQVNKNTQNKCSFHAHNNRVLGVFDVQDLAGFIHEKEECFASLKEDAAKEPHQVAFKAFSYNNMEKIAQKLSELGPVGWLDSLHLDFQFIKTDLVSRFLTILFEDVLEITSFTTLVRSFKQVNFEVNCASSDHLKIFPKIKPEPITNKETSNDLVKILKQNKIESSRFFAFNPTLFVKGECEVVGLGPLLHSLFL